MHIVYSYCGTSVILTVQVGLTALKSMELKMTNNTMTLAMYTVIGYKSCWRGKKQFMV